MVSVYVKWPLEFKNNFEIFVCIIVFEINWKNYGG